MNRSRLHLWICGSAAALLLMLMTAALNSPLAQYDQPRCAGSQSLCPSGPLPVARLLP
ncbi:MULTISPECIES: hypothetical protein [Halopseudomonas]|jgi:hypothetical protein|uniref:Uncharacterized protein n=1 Tax=Halopseudomonas aestusnigri TaxID=857252 RepID=A0AAQ1JPM3_9GAMM|nr:MULTISPECIES: hypothetical protein [Halopseudomonas]MDL2198078.1 hypothetical protein [Halopseudomonas aestusnigri]SEG05718.1 hypothetical protein SAMN05216586_10383 [Halopseudomonas aestusnigri]